MFCLKSKGNSHSASIVEQYRCCMAAGFNLQPQLAGGEAAAGLGMEKGAAQPQTKAVRPQGRADLRALTQPGPPTGRASPKTF
ncbi:hypothetical protein SGRA_2483 [Saprospira grandis str. Lewin]|uniref:Uncharacterized protein n=1 Tax=Saprospira grandis (strain Lewin) TaxID=984262 RepID=H6L5J5_SAPGL|nr:hypothetical protein SGRA_2483 [Saprospira grandis str. Lewin]